MRTFLPHPTYFRQLFPHYSVFLVHTSLVKPWLASSLVWCNSLLTDYLNVHPSVDGHNLLPPVQHSNQNFPVSKFTPSEESSVTNDNKFITRRGYHIGCFQEERYSDHNRFMQTSSLLRWIAWVTSIYKIIYGIKVR